MFLNTDKLSKAPDDRDFYRLFFIILCFVNLAFHYLFLSFTPQSIDPLWLRGFSCLICLTTIGVSYFDDKRVYFINAYFSIAVFLLVNNCYLLGLNNFVGEYYLGSLVCILLVSFFCRRTYEFIAFSCLVAVCFAGGFAFNIVHVDAPILVPAVIIFLALTYILFYYRRTYIVRGILMRNDVQLQKEELEQAYVNLHQKVLNLQNLISANSSIVLAYGEDRVCKDVWYPSNNVLEKDLVSIIGTNIDTLGIPQIASYFKTAAKTLRQTQFEFNSFFNNNRWYTVTINPVLGEDNKHNGHITITLDDVTDVKVSAAKVKENELVLYNEQVVAKMGSWWTDINGRDIHWSNNLFSILEVTDIPAEKSKLNYYISLIHPEDRDHAQHYFNTLANNPLNELEHRSITPKGNLKYFKVVSGYPVKDDKGKIVKVAGIVQDVTESKIANKLIRQSQAELMEVQAIAKIGGWKWDITLNDIQWSDEIYHIYEFDKDEVRHDDHFKLLLSQVHPGDKAMLAAAFKNPLKLTRAVVEYRIITKAGKIKYLNLIIGKTLKKDGIIKKIIGTLQDMTERKKIEFDFERAENKYKNVLETINLAAVTLNKNGDIVFCNKHLADIVGYERSELLGMNWVGNFVPEILRAQFRGWLETDNFYAQHTSPILCRNGKQRVINWKNTVTHDEFGTITETTSIGEDITEIKKAREALIMAKENAEKSSRFKSEFLSIMSHEIRTPMNAVIGTTNLLLQDNPAPNQLEYLHTLQFSSNNLLELINDILDYNKIEAGKLELYKLPFNISKLSSNLLNSFSTRAEENDTNLELVFDKNIPVNLIGDQLRLGQVLNNLLSNAVKFTKNGTVYLKLESQQVKFDKVQVKFTIADTGIGIAPENLEKIFDPFTQEFQSTQSDYGGTGLGLAITKRLVELHNSTINIVSVPGEGTEFSFTIVFEKANVDEHTESEAQSAKSQEDSNLKGMRVLLVDDNKMNLLIATKFLKNWQANVEHASNGKIAVEMAMATNYDVIIMDLQMPVMDGFEAASIIKQTQPEIPIIALSADAMPETHLKAVKYGMEDYLTKPFVPEILFSKIMKHYKGYEVN
ncbi:response regulator [Mucilaginibacter sp. HMF5004]|uniref:ATP-binding protein n=1 Tax=Mucilaginibacter rivuli TaxID=2857527 RepID=UPI001C5F127C|nr:ATP-binding protein [Mucilaginibacter rivuli]MBW4889715.1 response regulator [Mucilaginibacter rivuli]